MPVRRLYQVQRILDRRRVGTRRRYQYKVKWVGFPQTQCTWQPRANLTYVKDMINQYQSVHWPSRNPISHSRDQKPEKTSDILSKIRTAITNKQLPKVQPKALQKTKIISKTHTKPLQSLLKDTKKDLISDKDALQTAIKHHALKLSPKCITQNGQLKLSSPIQSPVKWSHRKLIPEKIDKNENAIITDMYRSSININTNDCCFKMSQNGCDKLLSRDEVMKDYPQALIDFYQRNLQHFE